MATTLTPSASATTKRTPSSASALPASRPPCTIDPTALIADKALLTGAHHVTIGAKAVIHPYARIRAEGGPVTIGEYCTVAENAIAGLPADVGGEVVLEGYVSVGSGAEVMAKRVGEGGEVGVQAKIGADAVLGRFSRVTALEVVESGERVEDFGVVFASGRRRVDGSLKMSREMRALRLRGQEKSVEVARKLVADGKAKWIG